MSSYASLRGSLIADTFRGPNWVGRPSHPVRFATSANGSIKIHGTDHNPILELANEVHDTTFSVPDTPPSVYDQTGHSMRIDVVKEHYDIMWGIIGEAFKHSKQDCASIPSDESLMDYLKKELEDMKLERKSSNVILAMAQIWGDFVGEPIEKQSLKFFWLEECIEGGARPYLWPILCGLELTLLENLFLAGTYQAVLKKIASAALKNADLRLNTKVTSIAFDALKGNDNPVAIDTGANGENICCDEVVVTCPLGWLKRNTSSFSPSLPIYITKAIENISYGRLEKVYLTFPKAFWSHDSNDGKTQPFFSNFLSPTYTDQNPNQWTVECVFLNTLPKPCAHPTLLFYIHGHGAQHVTSLIDGLDQKSEEYYTRLNDFFAPYYSRLPNYEVSSTDCKATTILATNWQNDEFAGYGSYTTFQTSQASEHVELDRDIEALREGCPDRRIWFAGEATSPFVALGTTTGAYWSGQAVAHRIAEVYESSD